MRMFAFGIAVLAMVTTIGRAQVAQGGAPRTILQRADATAPGYEVVAATADFRPGATTGWHTHPGEMAGFVVEGTLVVEQLRGAAVTYTTGQAFIIPAGTMHRDTNNGGALARMYATYVVQKGQPLNTER